MTLSKPNYFYCILISLLSVYFFIAEDGTAFEWPSVDMAPYFEKYKDSNYLENDFFTNSSLTPSPRHIFGKIVLGLSYLFHTNWYGVFFLLKSIFVILTPAFLFLFLFGIIKSEIDSIRKNIIINIFLAAGVILLLFDVSDFFSIAWWKPLFLTSTSQSLSLFLFLTGTLFLLYSSKYKYLFLILWAFSTLLHFTVGICLISFYFLATANHLDYKVLLLSFLIAVLMPVVVILFFFSASPQDSLSAVEFIEIYVKNRHPSHYLFSEFGTLTQYPWWVSYIFIVFFLLTGFVLALYKRNRSLIIVSLLFLISYSASPFAQLIFTEIFPSKFVAAFGPVRFSFLGYWMLLLLYGKILLISHIKWSFKFDFSPYHLNFKPIHFSALIVIAIISMFVFAKDDPYHTSRLKDQDLFNWVEKYTDTNAVFACYDSDYSYLIPLISKRAIFIGNGFPFSEKYFKEYQDRHSVLYGNYEQLESISGRHIGEKSDKFYGNLSSKEFISISDKYKLDYVIMKNEQGRFLGEYSPVFKNDKIKVYRVLDFIE